MSILEQKRNQGAADLAMAILQRASDDYLDLNRRGINSRSTKYEGYYSKTEIEDFFLGDFCKFLLAELKCSDKPEHLYKILLENTKIANT